MGHQVIAHAVHIFYPVWYGVDANKFDRDAKGYIGDLIGTIESLSIPEQRALDLLPGADNGLLGSLWKKGNSQSDKDFYPHIRQILGSHVEQEPYLCLSFQLREAKRMLAQVKGGKPRVYAMQLNSAASKRCGRDSIFLQLDEARFLLFRTGIGILDLSLHYHADVQNAPLDLAVLSEGNYFLSHDNYGSNKKSKTKVDVDPESAPPTQPQMTPDKLTDLVSELLPAIHGKKPLLLPDRRILYTLAQVDAQDTSPDELKLIATRLAHRQNQDYAPNVEVFESQLFTPFPYLCHATAIEGGASVSLLETDSSHYLRDFIKDAGPNKYIPLYLAELHSHYWLLMQSQWLPKRHGKADSSVDKKALTETYEATLDFRRYFHPVLVSQISMHNAFHQAWQKTLGIGNRLDNLEQTARQFADLVQERRTRWISRISGTLGGFILTREILESISNNGWFWGKPSLEDWLAELPKMAPAELAEKLHLISSWETGTLLGALAGAFIGYVIAWRFETGLNKE